MVSAHVQNYFVDNVAFAISVLPVAMLALVVMLERLQSYRRRFKHLSNQARVRCPGTGGFYGGLVRSKMRSSGS